MMKKMKISSSENKIQIRRMRRDPVKFIHRVLGIKYLTPEQEAIVRSVWANKYTGVKAAHSVGKTFIEACIVLAYVHIYSNSIVITTAPTARQVKDLLWAEINRLSAGSEFRFPGEMKMMGYSMGPKWFAAGIATEAGREEQSAVKFQGYHAKRILVVLDEAVGVHPAIWEAVDGITSGVKSKVLAVGNPSTLNCAFKKHLERSDWNTLTISALNHPNVTENREIVPGAVSRYWVNEKTNLWCNEVTEEDAKDLLKQDGRKIFSFNGKYYEPNPLFTWKVMGEFPEECPDGLIPIHKIQQAEDRYRESNSPPVPNENTFCHMSIDVARFGSDYSVFAINKNNRFITLPFYHLDTAKLAGEAINLIKIHKPTKVAVDCDGVGAGVFDNLNEAKNEEIIDVELYEIHGGSNPLALGQTEDFLNLRAQMYWMFKTDIDKISLEPKEELEEGFGTIRYFFNSKGKTQIEAKDEIKKRLGRSPDLEDAIVYCNFLKYSDACVSGTFECSDESEKYEPVTERIGVY
jgi:hypothetical protein